MPRESIILSSYQYPRCCTPCGLSAGADDRRSAGRLGGLGERVTRCADKQAEDCAAGTFEHPELLQTADESQRSGTCSS